MKAKDKLIKVIEKETGYKFNNDYSDKYTFEFYENVDVDDYGFVNIDFYAKDKTYWIDKNFGSTPISAELHKAIGEYMKYLGWI